MRHFFSFLLFFVFFPHIVHSSNIVVCKDDDGNTLYTASFSNCSKPGKQHLIQQTALPKSTKERINYRVPLRHYSKQAGQWEIYIESTLIDEDKALYRSAMMKLTQSLARIETILPENAARGLSKLKYYLLWGENSPQGGRKSGMSFIRRGETKNYSYLDKRWENAIVVYSAHNLDYLPEFWATKTLFHELAHAWHIANWPEKYPVIYNAWRNAKDRGLYLDVDDIRGKRIERAYALKNQLEYFAELSAIYFVGGNYFPYNRVGLKKYDLDGYNMVRSLWK